jgi:O-succinylbenzoate synthase
VELRLLSMPLVHPFETSVGLEEEHPAILVTLRGEGHEGHGECVAGADASYSYETTETAWYALTTFLIPAVLGREVGDPRAAGELMGAVRGHPMAKAALEEALWDLAARRRGRSVAALLGGRRRRIPVGVSVGLEGDVAALTKRVEAHLSEGYRRIKIKIKPGRDVGPVKALRRTLGDFPLQVDANGAYRWADVPQLMKLDRYDLLMIEQPLAHDDLVEHARLQARLSTPLCLDESITSPAAAAAALALGSCRVINVKKGRVGGLAAAKAVHDLCLRRRVPVWAGGMLEMGVGRAHNVALASLPNFKLPGDISATARYYEEDITEPPFVLNGDGTLTVPRGPGTGVEVLWDRTAEITRRMAVFQAP